MLSRPLEVFNKLVPENFTRDTSLSSKELCSLLQTPRKLHSRALVTLDAFDALDALVAFGAVALLGFLCLLCLLQFLRPHHPPHHRYGRQRERDSRADTTEAQQKDRREGKIRVHIRAWYADFQSCC